MVVRQIAHFTLAILC